MNRKNAKKKDLNHKDTEGEEKSKPPARLFVLLAREAPVGVILVHGANGWVQMVKWDTKKDVFTPGQWFHGRVDDHKCDLSPNGKLFVYFAKKYTRTRVREGEALWTAISKLPYFTALDLHFETDTWGGGGIFQEDGVLCRYLYVGHWSVNYIPSKPSEIHTLPPLPPETIFPYGTIDHVRRHLGGWVEIGRNEKSPYLNLTWQKRVKDYTLTFHEQHSNSSQEIAPYYSIKRDRKDTVFTLDEVSWADFDQQGRIVLSKAGKLFKSSINYGEPIYTELADFNTNQPEPVEAPEWARRW